MKEPRYGYMCLVDFKYELGEAMGGIEIYSTIKELKVKRKCVAQCGIVKVRIELEEIIQDSDYSDMENEESNT